MAGAAGVDPALVHHYFGNKDALFVAAMELPDNPAEVLPRVIAQGTDDLGERLVRTFLGVWDRSAARRPLLALVRSAASQEQAAGALREFLERALLRRIADALDTPDAELRAALVASQMAGLAVARYVLVLEPLASSSVDVLAAAVGPNVQRYLTGDLGSSPALAR